jgi:alkylhydroperoxidase family enzyme
MPRLRQVSRRDTQDELVLRMYDRLFDDRDPVAEPGTATGTPGDWWTVYALVPDVLRHAVEGFGLYRTRSVDPVLRELGQTRAGWLVGSQFVFSQHCKSMRALGVSEERIQAIPAWETSDLFSPLERAVLAYTDGLVQADGRVPDGVFDALRAGLSDEEILELTYVTAMYAMHATICRALRLEFDDRADPVVEVAAPEGATARDIGADISNNG